MDMDELRAQLLGDAVLLDEAAKAVGVSAKTLRRYRDAPDGLATFMWGGKEYVRLQTLRDYLAGLERQRNPRRRTRAKPAA